MQPVDTVTDVVLCFWGWDTDLGVYASPVLHNFLSGLHARNFETYTTVRHEANAPSNEKADPPRTPRNVHVHILLDAPKSTYWVSARSEDAETSPAQMLPLQSVDMSADRTLRRFVHAALAREKAFLTDASRLCLFVSGHGNGITMELESGRKTAVFSLRTALEEALSLHASWLGVTRRFSLLLLDSCFMSTVETVVELQPVAEYVCASEDYQWHQSLSSSFFLPWLRRQGASAANWETGLRELGSDFIRRNRRIADLHEWVYQKPGLTNDDPSDVTIVHTDALCAFVHQRLLRMPFGGGADGPTSCADTAVDPAHRRYADMHLLDPHAGWDQVPLFFEQSERTGRHRVHHGGLLVILQPQDDPMEALVYPKLRIVREEPQWTAFTAGLAKSCLPNPSTVSSAVRAASNAEGSPVSTHSSWRSTRFCWIWKLGSWLFGVLLLLVRLLLGWIHGLSGHSQSRVFSRRAETRCEEERACPS